MATEMYIDLYAKAPPYYTLTRDPDQTVYGDGTPGTFVAGGYGNGIAATRQEILNNLAQERENIFASIRGDNAGPITVLRAAVLDTTRVESLRSLARTTRDPARRAEYQRVADLEYQFAVAVQAAQQVIQDVVMAGAEWIVGDATYMAAKVRRSSMVMAAMREYNVGLPFGWPQKVFSHFLWGN